MILHMSYIFIYVYIYIKTFIRNWKPSVLDGVVFHLGVVLHIIPKLLDLGRTPSQEDALECGPALLVDKVEHYMWLQDGYILGKVPMVIKKW